jgi:hypothetical protein
MFGTLFSFLGKAAEALAPHITGAGPLLEAGKAITNAYQNLKEAGGTPSPDDEAAHDALFEKVKAHADSTFDRLDG